LRADQNKLISQKGFSFSGYERDGLFMNLGNKKFKDISGVSGIGTLAAVFGVLLLLLGRNAPVKTEPKEFHEYFGILQMRAAGLGFVAFLLPDVRWFRCSGHLSADATLRTSLV
jgi:hypothetical protein